MRKWILSHFEKTVETSLDLDEKLLRVVLQRLCAMGLIPDDYDEELIFETFSNGETVKEVAI